MRAFLSSPWTLFSSWRNSAREPDHGHVVAPRVDDVEHTLDAVHRQPGRLGKGLPGEVGRHPLPKTPVGAELEQGVSGRIGDPDVLVPVHLDVRLDSASPSGYRPGRREVPGGIEDLDA